MSVTLDEDEVVPGIREDGTPDPAYAASIGIVAATPARRSAAFAIDAAFFVLLLLPVLLGAVPLWFGMYAELHDPTSWFDHPDFVLSLIFYAVSQVLVTVFTIVQLVVHGVRGTTIGKAMVGIRSVNVATFGKPGFWRILLRAIVLSAAFTIVPYLGAIPFLLSPLWDPEKRGRGWLDRLGRNWLVDVRRGIDPFDSKVFRNAKRALIAPKVAEEQALPSLATGTAWAGTAFVPSARSSSGVVSHGQVGEAVEWEAPEIAAASPPATPTSAPAPTHRAALVFDDGVRLEVHGPGLIGRNPEPQPGEVMVHLYTLEDPARQLSKTHLGFDIDSAGVWIADRGSSNGTYVTTAGGATFALEAMKRTYVIPGSVVEIGDRTFTVGDAS